MLYQVSELKKEIRIALDRNNVSTQMFQTGDIDTLTLDELIESRICDAARLVETEAPSYLLDTGKAFADSIEWESEPGIGAGRILLPDNFMRLVCFQMSDWSRAVYTAIDGDNALYGMQSSRFAGVRGNPQKPVVAIINEPGGQVLEFYSCAAGESAYVKQARYIPFPEIEGNNVELCEKLKQPIIYRAASLVASSLGDAGSAQTLLNTCNELMK